MVHVTDSTTEQYDINNSYFHTIGKQLHNQA